VSIERDVYFNKDESLQPNDTQIEGEWDIPVNLDSTKVDSKPNNTPKYTKPADNDLNLQTNNDEINSTENTPEIQSEIPNNNTSEPTIVQNFSIPSPHDQHQRNSLQGLQQFDSTQYGHEKQSRNTVNLHDGLLAANEHHSALILEDSGFLEPGGVEIDVCEAEWFQEKMGQAMVAISEDEPSLREAMKGHERAEWTKAIEAELTQIERLHTWDLVEAPPDMNVILSRFVFRRKHDSNRKIECYKA
jgi:hypothetical protein